MYHVTITWTDGQITRATVTAKTLRGFRLTACRGCSIRIVKVRP
jgi:hypothetical protein